jgi:predicted translin family RNA/ssDNA-binding protein
LKYKFSETKFHPDQQRLTPQNISRIPTSKDISQTLSRVLLFTQSLNKTKQCSSSWSLVQRKKENTQTQDQFIQYLLPSLRSKLVSHDSFHTTTSQHHHHQADVHNLTSISYSFLQKLKSSETLEHLAEH